jgi:hypothetical protein
VLGNDPATLAETIDFPPPEEISAGKAAHPCKETLEIAQRVKPAQAQSAGVPNHSPSHCDALDDAIEEGQDEQSYPQSQMTESRRRCKSENAKRHGKSEN